MNWQEQVIRAQYPLPDPRAPKRRNLVRYAKYKMNRSNKKPKVAL